MTTPITTTEAAKSADFEHYEAEYMTPGRFYAWLECGRGDRQMSHEFGEISNNELREMLLSPDLTGQQAIDAMLILKDRFLREHSEEIAAYMAEQTGFYGNYKDES